MRLTGDSMSHIFVLYEPHDQPFARHVAVQIEQRGLVVWPVPDPASAPLAAVPDPDQGLETASHVLGILSPTAVTSEDLRCQCERALDLGKHVIAVISQSCDIPAHLQTCPVVDFRGQFLLAIEELVKRLEKADAPTRTLTVEHPPPLLKPDLLPITLPSERCWREDRLRINYILPIILTPEELEVRLPAFLVQTQFELVKNTPKSVQARRLREFKLFDPRRADHTLTVKRRKGSLDVYYRMTRTQVYYWFPAHYRVLDREAAALYRYLVTGKLTADVLEPVAYQARLARALSWGIIAAFFLIVFLLGYLIFI
jgi:hypothetical protein